MLEISQKILVINLETVSIIAACLEALSVLGGLCVSDIVYQIIQDKITEPFKDLGSQRVKNLSRPIRVWQ